MPATVSGEKAEGKNDDRQELEDGDMALIMDDDHHQPTEEGTEIHIEHHNFLNDGREDRFLDESISSIEDRHNEEDESMMTEVRHAGPPRFVFYCKDLPTLRAITEGEALMDPRADNSEGQVVDILLEMAMQKLLAGLGKTSAIKCTLSSVFTHNESFWLS